VDSLGNKMDIQEINLCYNLTDLEKIDEKILEIIEKKKECLEYYNNYKKYPKNTTLDKINAELTQV